MKIRIALIDNDVDFLETAKKVISSCISNYEELDGIVDVYSSCQQILEHINDYQCLFLDVEMPDENGIVFADSVRSKNTEISIIFMSSYVNYVFKSFTVNPFTYILKSELQDQGIKEIDRFLKHYMEAQSLYKTKVGHTLYEIKQKQILWIEKEGNYLILHQSNKQLKIRENINNILENLSNFFVLINKSEIVNLHAVTRIYKGEVLLEDNSIHYISRRKAKDISDAYYQFLKTEK